MPKDPVEFTIGDYLFRHHPPKAMPRVVEYDKLRVRLDHDSGVLNTLAFTFEKADFQEMASGEPSGVARLIRLLSMLIDGNKPPTNEPVDDKTADTSALTPERDELPRTLKGLCLYYAKFGRLESASKMADDSVVWNALQTEEAFNQHPCEVAPLVCAFRVIGELFAPFGNQLRDLYEKAKAERSSNSSSDNAEASEPTAPTSLT